MKKIAFAFFLFCVGTSFSQNCSYLANSVSEWDGSKLVITEPVALDKDFAEGKLQIYSSLFLNESVMLSFVIITKADITVAEGDSILVSFSSGESLTLKVFKQAVVSTKPERKISFNALLIAEDEKALTESDVDKITFKLSPLELSAFLKKKNQKAAIKEKDCIVSQR